MTGWARVLSWSRRRFLLIAHRTTPCQKSTAIYKSMRTAQTHFNEIGTSRACEILNLALIQPGEPVDNVYGQEAKKKAFLAAFQTFFAFIISSINKSDYLQFVPSAFMSSSRVPSMSVQTYHLSSTLVPRKSIDTHNATLSSPKNTTHNCLRVVY